jgi:hypothetical protein
MKSSLQNIPEDPDQMFFEFGINSTSAGAASDVASSPAPVAVEFVRKKAREFTRPVRENAEFVTESRAAELFIEVAQICRPNQVRRARIIFRPFRATLYSFKIAKGGVASVKFHIAFRSAPESVLFQAMQLMLIRRKAERRLINRKAYDTFVRSIPHTDFELPGAPKARRSSDPAPGKHRSLDESFERVNSEYFKSQLEKPELCWSPVRARRILGSYQERYDRLIISRVFDSPHVPMYVLDFLMFHELLHKFLGIGRRNDGKRLMHGREFREIERSFKYFDQAEAFLKQQSWHFD